MRAQGAQAAHHGLQCLQLQARAMQSTTLIEGRRVRSSPNLTLRYADALGSIQKAPFQTPPPSSKDVAVL